MATQVVDTINRPKHSGVMSRSMDAPQKARKTLPMEPINPIQRMRIQRVGQNGGTIPTDLETEIQGARGRGQSLDPDLQQRMGQAMGQDFSGVKVHTDVQANRLNESIQAKAFTTGNDVFFRQGES